MCSRVEPTLSSWLGVRIAPMRGLRRGQAVGPCGIRLPGVSRIAAAAASRMLLPSRCDTSVSRISMALGSAKCGCDTIHSPEPDRHRLSYALTTLAQNRSLSRSSRLQPRDRSSHTHARTAVALPQGPIRCSSRMELLGLSCLLGSQCDPTPSCHTESLQDQTDSGFMNAILCT